MLLETVSHYLPHGMLASRGFVLQLRPERQLSREQDILIIDETVAAPLFRSEGLIICHPFQVVASISVKTALTPQTLQNSLDTLFSIPPAAGADRISGPPWLGSYHFSSTTRTDSSPDRVCAALKARIEDLPADAATRCLACITSEQGVLVRTHPGDTDLTIQAFSSDSLSPALFITSLLNHIATLRGRHLDEGLDLFENAAFEHIRTDQVPMSRPRS